MELYWFQLTWADLQILSMTLLLEESGTELDLNKFPLTKRVKEVAESQPKIADYLENHRPKGKGF